MTSCHRRRARILQVHPNRRCNLTCQHCYTESGPDVRQELAPGLVAALVGDAAGEGYDFLAVSGGEPLMWRGLDVVLDAARAANMTVTLTTNGTLVTPRRARELAGLLDYAAVSVDGPPASHDRMRGAGTHARMQRGISLLREAGVRTGVIWTLTRANASELAAVYDFALAAGAAFVQIHPLEGVGYAARQLPGEVPDLDELVVAGLFASHLQDNASTRIPIHLDAAPSTTLGEFVRPDPDPDALLSALAEPLVVRADGVVVPGNYALPSDWAIGCVHDLPLSRLARRWRAQGLAAWRSLVEATLADLPAEENLVNFGALLLITARRLAARPLAGC